MQKARTDEERKSIATEAESARAAIADEAIARLAEEYENGAALDFFYADQLRDVQSSGFDIANFFAELHAGVDPAKEAKRLADVSASRDRALAARKAHPRYNSWLIDHSAETREAAVDSRNAAFVKNLTEVEKLLQTRNYEEAESRLRSLLQELRKLLSDHL